MSTLVPFEFDEPRAMQTGRGRRSSPMGWRWRDRLALVGGLDRRARRCA